MRKKTISLPITPPPKLGLKAGRINAVAFQQITQTLTDLSIPKSYSEKLANTILRLTPGSIDLLVKWKLLAEQEAEIIKLRDLVSITKMIKNTKQAGFTSEIKKLLASYISSPNIQINKLSKNRQTHLLSRLVPVNKLEKLVNPPLNVSLNTVFEILDSRFELIEQIDEALQFVTEHKTEMNGDSIIWRFFIMYGLNVGKENFLEAELFVEANAHKFRKGYRESDTGKTAAWRNIADYGLAETKKMHSLYTQH
ncbi:MAG: hypothetical protein PHF25_05685 [Candidatus Margulisbacteria bacterium]|nr:hypothetical protein [Candidatus Margulisiibacteriota bacterium]